MASPNSIPEIPWRCFHCDFTTSDPKEAESHFGDNDEGTALCQDWAEMNVDERAGAFQGAVQELNGEREENAKLRTANKGLEYQVNGFATDIEQYFKGCRTPYEAFCKYDSMEGRALAAEEQLSTLKAATSGSVEHKESRLPTREELDAEMYPCLGCGVPKSGANGGSIYWWCPECLNKDRTPLAPEATNGR